jgi:hypothetical protein
MFDENKFEKQLIYRCGTNFAVRIAGLQLSKCVTEVRLRDVFLYLSKVHTIMLAAHVAQTEPFFLLASAPTTTFFRRFVNRFRQGFCLK